jgi:hypothetical protein
VQTNARHNRHKKGRATKERRFFVSALMALLDGLSAKMSIWHFIE